jgi:hypothetical protein
MPGSLYSNISSAWVSTPRRTLSQL